MIPGSPAGSGAGASAGIRMRAAPRLSTAEIDATVSPVGWKAGWPAVGEGSRRGRRSAGCPGRVARARRVAARGRGSAAADRSRSRLLDGAEEADRRGQRREGEGRGREHARLEQGAPLGRRLEHGAARRPDPGAVVPDAPVEAVGHRPADPLDGRRHQQPTGAGEREGQPAEGVRQVGPVVVGVRRPRRGEEEQERQRGAAERGGPEREPGQRAEAHGDLRERDQQADLDGKRLDRADEHGQRRDPGELGQLALDRRGARRIEERRVDELVEPGVDEGDAEEQAQRQQRDRRHARAPEPIAERWRDGLRRPVSGPRHVARLARRHAGRAGASLPSAHRSARVCPDPTCMPPVGRAAPVAGAAPANDRRGSPGAAYAQHVRTHIRRHRAGDPPSRSQGPSVSARAPSATRSSPCSSGRGTRTGRATCPTGARRRTGRGR